MNFATTVLQALFGSSYYPSGGPTAQELKTLEKYSDVSNGGSVKISVGNLVCFNYRHESVEPSFWSNWNKHPTGQFYVIDVADSDYSEVFRPLGFGNDVTVAFVEGSWDYKVSFCKVDSRILIPAPSTDPCPPFMAEYIADVSNQPLKLHGYAKPRSGVSPEPYGFAFPLPPDEKIRLQQRRLVGRQLFILPRFFRSMTLNSKVA